MNTIKVSNLESGMMFDQPVYIDEENILVPEKIPLKSKDIERLLKWGIETVQTDGDVIDEEALKRQEEQIRKLTEEKTETRLRKLYLSSVDGLNKVFEAVKGNQKPTVEEIDQIVNSLFPVIRESSDIMINLTLRDEEEADRWARGSVNCMILSVVIGLHLRMPTHRLIHLALGALLHDIGMMRIQPGILNKKGNLSRDDIHQIRTHTLHSYKIITKELGYPEEIGMIALQHHERWDGKGYPRRLNGKGIMLSSRIVSVTDAFEAMSRDRPYRNSMIGYTAMRQLLNDNSRRFDSDILRVFIKSMGIYPVGSIVILNNGAIGQVTKIHGDAPLRPVLNILLDESGRKINTKEIDLLGTQTLFIARALNPKELQGSAK